MLNFQSQPSIILSSSRPCLPSSFPLFVPVSHRHFVQSSQLTIILSFGRHFLRLSYFQFVPSSSRPSPNITFSNRSSIPSLYSLFELYHPILILSNLQVLQVFSIYFLKSSESKILSSFIILTWDKFLTVL